MKPHIRCYEISGYWWFHWPGRGTWRWEPEDAYATWDELQAYGWVPWVGF